MCFSQIILVWNGPGWILIFFPQKSTNWRYLISAHDKPIILAKESLTVQFSVFERLQFCCRMLLNVNGGQARAASTIFSKRSCNKFFQNASKTLNGLAIQLQCLYPPQYMVDVFEAQCDLQWMWKSKFKDKVNFLRQQHIRTSLTLCFYVFLLKDLRRNTKGNDTSFDIHGAFPGHKLPPIMDKYFLVQEKAQQCTRHLR